MDEKKLPFIEGWTSIGLNTVLFALKYIAGIGTGSIAVIADAWHTLSDSLTSVVVIIGAKFMKRPADDKHPFGHGRAELIASVIIGVMLISVAFNFLVDSVRKLMNRETVVFDLFTLVVFSCSVVFKEAIARFSFWAARKTGSSSLYADGWHHRSDAVASLLVLAGIFLGRFFWWIDAVLGTIISLLIGYTAFTIIRDGINPLIGEKPDPKLLETLGEIVDELYRDPHRLHHVHLHRYGEHFELTFHLEMDPALSIRAGHDIINRIEQEILNRLKIEATIHLEPLN